jgi:hypothetical protein
MQADLNRYKQSVAKKTESYVQFYKEMWEDIIKNKK